MRKIKNILVFLVITIFTGCTSDNNANELTNSDISVELKKSLAYMGNEERLAFDLYNEFYELFPDITQLTNIANRSEIKHIQAVQKLIKNYEITGTELSDSNFTSLYYQNKTIPEMTAGVYGVLSIQELYNALIIDGSKGEVDALKVACKVEVIDIEDLNKYLLLAKNTTDIKDTFEFLRSGSYIHYWRFDESLKNKGVQDGCNLGTEPFGDKTDIYPKKL
jgi:hypothetical protein